MPRAPRLSVVDGKWKRSQEVKLRERSYRILQKQCLWLVNNLSRIKAFTPKKNNKVEYDIDPFYHYKKNTIHADIDSLLSDLPWLKTLVDAIVASNATALVRGGNRTIALMELEKYGISFTLKNPKVTKILQARKALELSERDGTISRTTKDRIHDILVKGAEDGLSYTEMGKQIKQQAVDGVFSKARGERIAVREIGLAYGQGQDEVVQEFRAAHPELQIEKIWITAGDDLVRDTHRENAQAGWIDYDQEFPGTGEQTAPSEDFGCRCTYSTRIAEKAKADKYEVLSRKVSSIRYDIGEVQNNISGIVSVAATASMLDSKLEEVESRLANSIEAIELIPGEKGEKGDRGENGVNGINGMPGKDGADSTVPGPQGEKGEPGEDGKNGKDGSPDTPKQIVTKLESLKGADRLDARAIKNLGKYIPSMAPGSSTTIVSGSSSSIENPMTVDLVGTDFISTRSGSVTRDAYGYISSIAKVGGRTITYTRDADHYITSVSDGTRTWTISRDVSHYLTAWSVA